jgi:hypothetical protein
VASSPPLAPEEQEEPATTEREWRVQRAGWVLLALIVVAALAGVFGPGPLSWSTTSAADGSLSVEYSRFARNGGPIAVRLEVAPSAAVDGQVQVVLSSELLDSLEVRQIVPEPESQASTDDGVVFTFALEGDDPLEASVSATADAMGLRDGAVGLQGEPPLEFWQLFYP